MFKTVNKFDEKCKSILTNSEYYVLTNRYHHKISNFYMLSKLYKSKKIREIIEVKRREYIQIDDFYRRLANCSWSCFWHKWNIRNFTLCYETCFISNTTNRFNQFYAKIRERMPEWYITCNIITYNSTCDIKFLYTKLN